MSNSDFYFIASAWNTGTGFTVKGFNFIITTTEVTGNSQLVVVKNSDSVKKTAKVLYKDYALGLAFVELPFDNSSKIDVSNLEFSFDGAIVKTYRTNFYCETIEETYDVVDRNYIVNNLKYILLAEKNVYKASSKIVYNSNSEIIGLLKYQDNNKDLLVIPAKYILKNMEEFSTRKSSAIRCTACNNIVKIEEIEDNFCPVCNTFLNPQFVSDCLPELSNIETEIEKTLENLGYTLNSARIGRFLWEIEKGSASIFIRYEPDMNFIVAFSHLSVITESKKDKILNFLLNENSKLNLLSFSINKNRAILSTPYVVADDFDKNYSAVLLNELFQKADDYDDIINNL